ncbi:hypothetical protein HBI56_205010 [Parastagonospora nodorum]|nr:hypothetical protein HBI10_124340 [Parastagonospora nodorum]KAH4024277.1 hypothetical protein HBI13_085190 [Parastagonospora nodorum]KAH4346629.1 hypothetical protein HBH98_107420 [Parastagonospora nodorum]KAH4385638.1 hypothetical protein HBH97_064110 [Parastagonospora nodorum]KAH4399515.1 hypothetical protein HBH99_095480 [Parastagonospora nodorum]
MTLCSPLVLFLSVLSFSTAIQAQFIQRWLWSQTVNPAGQPVPLPYWHREANMQYGRVMFTRRRVVLEYNCDKMPAICMNANNWMNSAAATWPGRQANVFTWDIGHSRLNDRTNRLNSEMRRDLQCPSTWKGTALNPRCPEPNQPRVVPPLYNGAAGVTALKLPLINPTTGHYEMRIADGSDTPGGTLQESGRIYTCDEFPPASWVEGGVGTPGQNNPEGDGGPGTTFCAPMSRTCAANQAADPHDGRGSEQDWQGIIHGKLGATLTAIIGEEGNRLGQDYDDNSGIAFLFRAIANVNHPSAARVYYEDNGEYRDSINPGTSFRRRSLEEEGMLANATLLSAENLDQADLESMGFVSIDFVPNDSGSLTIKLPNGKQLAADDQEAYTDAIKSGMTNTTFTAYDYNSFASNSTSAHAPLLESESSDNQVPRINVNGAEGFNLTYKVETQRQPIEDSIDILAIGTEYIRGSVYSSNSTQNATDAKNATDSKGTSSAKRITHRGAHQHFSHKRQAAPVEGPIQCGPGQPCLDGSCCNSDGKCGFKEHNCGAKCISNCDAKAMCGIDSADGKTPCGLKLCCSYYGWCGTETVHCIDPEPQFMKTSCQQGFGGCTIVPSPVCGKGSGTASKGRRVGYYQGWNSRERACDKVPPRLINTRGLTHLFYSFAFFDPTTFEMTPMNAADVPLYGEFTALKRNGLQTWIAVGGWSFNDEGPTYNAYSNMVSMRANRAAFISSLIRFMDTYGFQGADIDWEYPAEPKRGGRKEDTDNLVLLMKEMHEAFAGRYGSSLTIAPDYWYLRGFKPAAMQDYVDFMGFMSYDLHGPWDQDVKTLGSIVRPQTDITEINKNLKPLWFDGVDPAKINFGIAYYGRTYKLSDPSCDKMGCRFVVGAAGAPGKCTQFAGVLSNREIRQILKDDNSIKPYFNTTAMVKYFKYAGDSWVGYDDAETFAMKEEYANHRCLGGIMIWSVDFDDETGVGLGSANGFKSPESATVIPMAHTTVPRGQTFTINPGAATDVPRLPNGGTQNTPQGPEKCQQCSFFRLITSTCCGTGGSVGNPIAIQPNVPTPMDIPLPAGFTPDQSFRDSSGNVIPANQPLPREGDDQNSNSSSLVWLSPEIWEDPNPEVQCLFPCTFVLPPWPSYTTTVDYPRITVTRSGTIQTILTFPPLTVSQWEPSTIIASASSRCTTDSCSGEDLRRTSSVSIRSTTTWPPVTWTDSGTVRTTYPPTATRTGGGQDPTGGGGGGGGNPPCLFPLFCPPGPPPLRLPSITVIWGPPKPTTTPCAYSAPGCPAPGSKPPRPGGLVVPPGLPPQEPEEVDPEEVCPLVLSTTKIRTVTAVVTVASTSTKFTQAPTPTLIRPSGPRFATPDWSKDELKCYDSGQRATRIHMINGVDRFCDAYKGRSLYASWYSGEIPFTPSCCDRNHEVVPISVIVSLEMHGGCQWDFDVNDCKRAFRRIIDECDTNGRDDKQGGRLVGNCVTFRADPNAQ